MATGRLLTGELMDDPGLDREAHEHALRALGRAATVSRTAASMWPAIHRAALQHPDRPLRVLDIACGGGDVAIDVARRMAGSGIAGEVVGCDVSPVALEYATALAARAAARGPVARVQFARLDVLRDPWPEGFDVVVCSLFLHHLSNADAVTVLQRMATAATRAVVISDLCRTALGAAFAWIGCRLLSRSNVFHVDGMRSVRAAFTTDEALALAHAAGLQSAAITTCWPERFVLTWTKDPS